MMLGQKIPGQNKPGQNIQNISGQNIPGQNIQDKIYPDNTYRIKDTETKHTFQYVSDNMYRYLFSGIFRLVCFARIYFVWYFFVWVSFIQVYFIWVYFVHVSFILASSYTDILQYSIFTQFHITPILLSPPSKHSFHRIKSINIIKFGNDLILETSSKVPELLET